MIKYQRFRREFMTWRVSQFRDLCNLSNITELPYGCILHIFDNFPMDGHVSWGPRDDNYFTHMNNFRLFIHNVLTWPEIKATDVAKWNKEKMILTNGGVHSGIMQYLRNMMPRVRYCAEMKDLPIRPSTMSIVNYNPLFRTRVLGVRKKIRFFNFFLAVLLNKICEAPDRQHFIHIPLESFTYEKKDFIRIFRKFDRIATLYPERSSYLFLAHFYGILVKRMTLPKRGSVNKNEMDSEDDLTSSEEMLDAVLPDTGDSDLTPEMFMKNIAQAAFESPSIALESLREGENPYKNSIFEFMPATLFEKINLIFTVGDKYVCYNLRDMKEINGNANVGLLKIIAQLNMLVRTSEGGAVNDSNEETPAAPESVMTIDETKIETGNVIDFQPTLSRAEKIDAAEVDLLELEDVSKILNDMPTATAKQKEHVVKLSKAYKDLKIDEVPFKDLLANVEDDTLDPPKIETASTDSGAITSASTASSTAMLNPVYIEKQLKKDIAAICTSFNKQGMFLTGFTGEKVNDELNSWTVYKAEFEDTAHKKHRITIPVPRVDKMGRTKINGTMKAMRMQRISKPICKVSDTRVTINSNYNKALIERNTNMSRSFIDWFTKKAVFKINKAGFKFTPESFVCRFPMMSLPFEITELGRKYKTISFDNGKLVFDYTNRFTYVPKKIAGDAEAAEINNGIWFGYKGDLQFFISVDGMIIAKNLNTEEEEFCGAFGDFIVWLTGVPLVPPVEYIEITYLSKTVPLIHMLAYRYGLTNMLKYCSCDYSVYDKNERIETRPSDIVVHFKDKKIIINKTPRNNALLFGGLTFFDFGDVYLEDMDGKDAYYTLLDQCKVSMNFIKGVDSFFELFMDPITRDVLRDMREPTDVRDLLLHAVTLLTTSEHLDEASEANFRYRSSEQISGAIYNEMARAFATYKNRSIGATNRFSLSEFAIKQRIIQDQNMEIVPTINPIDDIKQYSEFTNSGTGGRGNDTFLIKDRRYSSDSLGIVSEATKDSGKVGMVASLPANPIIANSRGISEKIPIADLQPENILSFNSLLMPCVTNDDAKRANMSSIQASHVVPINGSEVNRVRTGFEELVAHRTRPPFAFPAEEDGTVLSVDDKAGAMVIRYKSGKKVLVNFGEEYSNNSSNGFFVNQEVVINGYKKGDAFKKGEILTYNQQFFQADPYDKKTVRYKLGVQAKVAIIDNGGTIEDASILTQPLCDKMIFNPVHQVEVILTTDTNIRQFAHIGDEVNSTDSILVWDESAYDPGGEEDQQLIEMLSKLNNTNKRAGHTGKVVKIEALYKSPLSSMAPTMQKLIRHSVEKKNLEASLAEGCINSEDHLKSMPLVGTTKVGTTVLEPETVIIRYYIKQTKSMSPGDKLFFDTSLKSVVAQVYPECIDVEDGSVKVEAATSGRGILARIITSPFLVGIAGSCLEKLEKECLEIWDS